MNKSIKEQLNILKEVKPSALWKENNRSLLISQITSAEESKIETEMNAFDAIWKSFVGDARVFFAQPSVFVVALVAVLIGGTTLTPGFVNNAQPGDSLYIAKMVSEKAQLAMTFNDAKKAKLGLEFAENRTREITRVLVKFNESKEEKDDRVQQLTDDFKDEIVKIKTYNVIPDVTNVAKVEGVVTEEVDEELDVLLGEEGVVDPKVFSAFSGKSDEGIELVEVDSQKDLHEVLDNATELIDSKDYVGTLSKLEEATAIIDGAKENGIIEVDKVDVDAEVVDIIDEIDGEVLHATSTAGSVSVIEVVDEVVQGTSSLEIDGELVEDEEEAGEDKVKDVEVEK